MPHHGAHAAYWADFVTRFTAVFKDTDRELVKTLQEDSPVLAAISHDFGQFVSKRQNAQLAIAITCFHKEYAMKTPAGAAVCVGFSLSNIFFVQYSTGVNQYIFLGN